MRFPVGEEFNFLRIRVNYAMGVLYAPSGVGRVITSDGWCVASIEVQVETWFQMVVESAAGFFCNESRRASV